MHFRLSAKILANVCVFAVFKVSSNSPGTGTVRRVPSLPSPNPLLIMLYSTHTHIHMEALTVALRRYACSLNAFVFVFGSNGWCWFDPPVDQKSTPLCEAHFQCPGLHVGIVFRIFCGWVYGRIIYTLSWGAQFVVLECRCTGKMHVFLFLDSLLHGSWSLVYVMF